MHCAGCRLLSACLLAGCGGLTGSEGAGGSGGSNTLGTGGTGTAGSFGMEAGAALGGRACTNGDVTFHVLPGGDTTVETWCLGDASSCQNSSWPSIRTDSGQPLLIADWCQTPCETCITGPCPATPCLRGSVLPAEGLTTHWDGTYFATGTCGAGITCENQECAAPGTYLARICYYFLPRSETPGLACASVGPSEYSPCLEAPFTYPSSTVVEVTLPGLAAS